jgi:hypothetical protein
MYSKNVQKPIALKYISDLVPAALTSFFKATNNNTKTNRAYNVADTEGGALDNSSSLLLTNTCPSEFLTEFVLIVLDLVQIGFCNNR